MPTRPVTMKTLRLPVELAEALELVAFETREAQNDIMIRGVSGEVRRLQRQQEREAAK